MLCFKDLSSIQQSIVNLIVDYHKLAIFLDPGGGKTAATLYGMKELNFNRCLIVGTPRICETVWKEESAKWKELDFSFTKLIGSPQKRKQLLNQNTDFHLISYDLLHWLSKEVVISRKYDALIFDELSLLKSPGTNRFKSIRHHIDHVKIAIGLTGTPTGNSLLGLWSQLYACVGSESPIGRTYGEFKCRYFMQGGFKGREWIPNASTFFRLMDDLQDYAFSFEVDKSEFPIVFNPIQLKLPASVKRHYDEMKECFYVKLQDKDIFAFGDAPMQNKLRQMEAGAIYDLKGKFIQLHQLQLEAVEDLIEELNGKSLIIVYEFRFQLELIKKRWPKVLTKITSKSQQEWNEGKHRLLAIHPKSCGHGVNLQHGGRHMVFLSAPWSVELWIQTIGRIYGRKDQKLTAYIYHFKGFEVENRVIQKLKYHERVLRNTFKELKYAT